MDRYDFEQWVDRWQNAWTHGDVDAFGVLLAPVIRWQRAPYTAPLVGHAQVEQAVGEALGAVSGIAYAASVVAFDEPFGVAHWSARLTPAEGIPPIDTDGVLVARFDESGRCIHLAEWWHTPPRDQ